MTVITMTREMGTLGKDVAVGVAQLMGLEVIHHELVERDVAERMHLEESDVHRFLEGTPSLTKRWKIDQDKLSKYTAEEIYDLANQDNVLIRGWGATALLRKVPHIPRVRVCAPMDFRVSIMQERLALDDARLVLREIKRNDAAHTRTMHRFLGFDRENSLNYDLVLNTERLPISDCVKQVASLVESDVFAATDKSQQILTDLILESEIHNCIARNRNLGSSGKHLEVIVGGGNVVIAGAVLSKEIGMKLCDGVRTVPGVKSVTNNMVAVDRFYRG